MTAPVTPINPGGWAPYLDPDERLLWEGTPRAGLRFKASDAFLSFFGAVFFGFSAFWIAMAGWLSGDDGAMGILFPLFGLPFLLVGAYLMAGRFFWDSYARSRTRYALTSKRGIIAKEALGRSLKSYPIRDDTEIDYQPGPEAIIYFGKQVRRGKNGTYVTNHGFEYIQGGDEVYRLIRAVQQNRIEVTE